MKIQGSGGLRGGAGAKKTGRTSGASGSDFARKMADGDETSVGSGGGVSGMGGVNALDALLALQQVEDSTSGPSRAKQRAEDMLDKLDELKLYLLAGGIPKEKLSDLTQLVQSQRAEVDDPRLVELLDEIDLRAQVELAKYEQRAAG
jgi:hypothetical protein